jgi:hypothetical protein
LLREHILIYFVFFFRNLQRAQKKSVNW